MYALRRSCCRNHSTARMRPSAKTSGTTRVSRCVATQPGSPSSNLMRRRGYVAASCAPENARGSSVRAASSATQSPTAGAPTSSAAARRDLAEDLVEVERRRDDARQPGDLLEAGEPPVGGRTLAAQPARSRRPASSRSRAGPAAQKTRSVHPKCWHRHASAPSPTRAQARQQWARPASTRQLHAGFAQPPAVTSGAAAMPPGNFGTGGAGAVRSGLRHPECRRTAGP